MLKFIKMLFKIALNFVIYLWTNIFKNIFQAVTSAVSRGISKTIITVMPIVTLTAIGLYFNKPILNNVIEFQENYIEQILDLSLEKKLIGSLTRFHFWSEVFYDSLNTERDKEKIDMEYKKWENSFKKWKDNLPENLKFIQDNVSQVSIKKRNCLGKDLDISESECQLKKIDKVFQELYEKLKSCYDHKKRNLSCSHTLSDYNQKFRIPIDNGIIQFYKAFQKDKKQ